MLPSAATIKRHPIVIARNLVLVEIIGYGAFLVAAMLADYGELYGRLSLTRIASYEAAYFLFIALGQITLTLFVFLSWFYSYYRITPQRIFVSRGIVFRQKTIVPLERIHEVSYTYSAFGKIFGYGTLVLSDSGKLLRLTHVPKPHRYATLLAQFQKMVQRHNGSVTIGEPAQLLEAPEGEQLEFKSTMRWDMQNNQPNRYLEKMVLKTVAAFLNSNGGNLILGVDDGRAVVGLEKDYRSLTRQDRDGFENHFNNVFNNAIGAEFRQFVKLHFARVGEKDICIVNVQPAARPAYLRFDKGEEFYVRTGNSTTALSVSEVANYLDLWRSRVS